MRETGPNEKVILMRKIKISLLVVFFAIALDVQASPLIFKTTKEIKTDTSEEIAVFDATKYRNLRIGAHIFGRPPMGCVNIRSKAMLLGELERLREGLKAGEQQIPGVRFPADYRERQLKQIAEKEEAYKNALEFPCADISIFVVEDNDEFRLNIVTGIGRDGVLFGNIETPPRKLRIMGNGIGKYKIYIWGE
jgi:hypothetical protein